jgi:hypothetical protein
MSEVTLQPEGSLIQLNADVLNGSTLTNDRISVECNSETTKSEILESSDSSEDT